MRLRLAALTLTALLAACSETPTESVAPAVLKPVEKSAVVSNVYTSDASVTAWDPIYIGYGADWGTSVCTTNPAVSLTDSRWTNPHAASDFGTNAHVWQPGAASNGFVADWINAWTNTSSGGGPGYVAAGNPGAYNWTKYERQVTGNGSFQLQLLADNCSWIYLDNVLVGVQPANWNYSSLKYGVTLNGTHKLTFVIFDGGGAAGGMFRLETTTNVIPPLNNDLDGDGHLNDQDAFPLDPLRWDANNLVSNGSFERPIIGATWSPNANKNPWITISGPAQGLPSWNVDAGNVDVQSGEGGGQFTGVPDGVQVLDLNGATISQGVATKPGYKYRVSFALSQNYFCMSGVTSSVKVSFGAASQTFSFTPHSGESWQNMRWDAASFEATSSGASTTLSFASSVFGGCGGSMLDAVKIEEIGVADNSGPVITPTVTGTKNGDWYTSDVNITWSVVDAESAVTSSTGCDAVSITSDTNGQTITCTATSGGGTSTGSVTIKRDASAPVITPAIAGTLGANNWYTSNVVVSWTVTDATSGIASSTGCTATTTSTDNTGTTYTCSATNGAGLTATQSVTAKRDASAPVITPSVVGTLGLGGWYTSNIVVSFSTADATSGVASTSAGCAPITTSVDNAGTTYSCTAANGAGLSATQIVSAKRDATKPNIGYTGNLGTYTVDQTVAITCAASDAMSGIASSTCANISGSAYAFVIGANTYSATAKDVAGNTNAASTSFTVKVTPASLCTLVQRFVTKAGIAKSLCEQLVNGNDEKPEAGDDKSEGKSETKVLTQSDLKDFREHVQAQSGKAMTTANANLLIALSKYL